MAIAIRAAKGRFSFAAAAILAVVFVVSIVERGTPWLRHDWFWPPTIDALRLNLIDSASGWSTYGLGAARAYPTDYLLDIFFAALSLCGSSFGTLMLFLYFVGFTTGLAARALITEDHPSAEAMRVGLSAIALFNPWTYNEVVAGHSVMILAYGGAMLLAARLLAGWADKKDWWRFLLVFSQIQFLVISVVFAALPLLRKRAYLTLATLAVLFLPIAYGVISDRGTLLSIPYFIRWQEVQSVPMLDALQLQGYASDYAQSLGAVSAAGFIALGAALVAAVRSGWRAPAWRIGLVLAIFFALAVSGTKGPLAPPYRFIVTHVMASGTFRELYDLVAFVCIGYLLMLSRGPRSSWFAAMLVLSGACFTLAWMLNAPAHFWPQAAKRPEVAIAAVPQSRYVLEPAFQPLSLRDREGSGADPDAWLRDGDQLPLNVYLPGYPVAPALAKLVFFGDAADVRALGASSVTCRREFVSGSDAMNAIGIAPTTEAECRSFAISPVPLVGLSERPGIEIRQPVLGSGNIYFTDNPAADQALRPPLMNVESFDASRSWIDLRLVWKQRPYLALPVAASFTASHEMLTIVKGNWLLANVRGRLYDDKGKLLAHTANGYQWIRAENVRAVRCDGECAVAGTLTGSKPVGSDREHVWKPVAFKQLLPWLAVIHVDPQLGRMLMYNVSYDPAWFMWPLRSALHVRLDGATNAWVLPGAFPSGTVWIIHRVAMLQACLEACAVIWLAVAAYLALSPVKRALWSGKQRVS